MSDEKSHISQSYLFVKPILYYAKSDHFRNLLILLLVLPETRRIPQRRLPTSVTTKYWIQLISNAKIIIVEDVIVFVTIWFQLPLKKLCLTRVAIIGRWACVVKLVQLPYSVQLFLSLYKQPLERQIAANLLLKHDLVELK